MKFKELPEKECEVLLTELFLTIPDLLQEVAPEGFQNSELFKVYHPSPEQRYKEYRFSQLRLIQMQRARKNPVTVEPTKSYDAFVNELKEEAVEEQYETVSILGNCLWKIFSNNHTVYNERYEAYERGSWRGSGGFIADVINKLDLVPGQTFDYLDFYMGHYILQDRADLTKVYQFIFRKLMYKGLDWDYSFPRMGFVNFSKRDDGEQRPEDYDPAEAMKQQLEQQQEQQELNSFQQMLDDIYHQEYEKAKYKKPAQEVMAYYNVYGHWPNGHPLNDN